MQRVLIFCCLLVLSGQSFSLQVEGLFSESIVILNDSDSERSRAYSEALRAVLIKLTGSEDAIRAPVLLRALESAGEYVDAVSYGTEAETLRDAPTGNCTFRTQSRTTNNSDIVFFGEQKTREDTHTENGRPWTPNMFLIDVMLGEQPKNDAGDTHTRNGTCGGMLLTSLLARSKEKPMQGHPHRKWDLWKIKPTKLDRSILGWRLV